jgi:hypothetical protein
VPAADPIALLTAALRRELAPVTGRLDRLEERIAALAGGTGPAGGDRSQG